MKQVKWDKYEAALLIEAYWKIVNSKAKEEQIVSELSQLLRKRAMAKGLEIDQIYRNENGIRLRLKEMEYLFTYGLNGTSHTSSLFQKMVDMYRDHREEYERLLSETKTELATFFKEEVIPTSSSNGVDVINATDAQIEREHPVLYRRLFEARQTYDNQEVELDQIRSIIGGLADKASIALVLDKVSWAKKIDREVYFFSERQIESESLEDRDERFLSTADLESVYLALKERSQQNRSGTTAEYLASKTNLSAGYVRTILLVSDWASLQNGKYYFVDVEQKVQTLDFNKSQSLEFTKPISCTYFGDKLDECSSWRKLLVALCRCLYEDYPEVIEDLAGQVFAGSSSPLIVSEDRKDTLRSPFEFSSGLFVEQNKSAADIVRAMRRLLDVCRVDYENVVIEFEQKQDLPVTQKQTYETASSETEESLIRAAFDKTVEYLSSRYEVRLAYDHINNSRKFYKDVLYKVNNGVKDIIWVYYLSRVRLDSYVSVELEPEYLNYFDGEPEGFDKVEHRASHPCQKMIFTSYEAIQQSLEKMCDSIDTYFLEGNHKRVKKTPVSSTSQSQKLADYDKEKCCGAIGEYLHQANGGKTFEEIAEHFSEYSSSQIYNALIDCHSVNVLKQYYHRDEICDYEIMADTLLEILLKQFAANDGYTSAKQLYDEAHARLDDFFFYNNDVFETRQGVFALAEHLFSQEEYKGHKFVFSSHMHVWEKEPAYSKDYRGLTIKYAREHNNVFSREEIISYYEWIGSTSAAATFSNMLFTSGEKDFLQYNENQFVLADSLNVDDRFLGDVQAQIEKLLDGDDYIAFGEVDDFFYSTLPILPANVSWSPLLMEDVLRLYDLGFITIKAGKNDDKKTVPAALIRKQSPFRTLGDVIWNEVSNSYSFPKEFTASEFRDFLLEKGLIHGSEKLWNTHKIVEGDIRFYWTENNTKVTIS